MKKAAVLGWIAVGISTLVSSLWAFWGVYESFHEGWYFESLIPNVILTVKYCALMLIFVALSVTGLRWPRAGGILYLLFPALGFSQQSNPLSFEVASIKPAETLTPAMIAAGKIHVGMSVDGARVDIGYLSLADLIPIAFKMKPHQISGPDWMKGGQRFDILAKLPEGSNKDQVPEMLQSLLAERFQLKAHRETRDLPVYALTVSKGGHKLKESPADPEAPAGPPPKGAITLGTGDNRVQINASPGGATLTSAANGTMRMSISPEGQMRMEISKVTMTQFAEMLTRLVDRPVIDRTELKGNFQVALDLSMENLILIARASGMNIPLLPGAAAGAASDPSGGGSVFSSLQQLGLKLEPQKAPMEFLVVDHLEKMPTEN